MKCDGIWRNICDLTYDPNDLVCMICNSKRDEFSGKQEKKETTK